MPVSWRDDPETYRAAVIKVVLAQVKADPQGFKEKTKPTVQANSKSRRKIKKTLLDVLDWAQLARSLPDTGLTVAECQDVWRKSFDAKKLIKGGWTRTEDTLLDELVKAFGTKHWAKFCAYIPGRNGKQCRERWLNHLNPNLKKGPWEQSELDTLVKFQRVYGNSWARIAQHLPGRAENAVKNQWNSMMHRSFSNMMAGGARSGGGGRAGNNNDAQPSGRGGSTHSGGPTSNHQTHGPHQAASVGTQSTAAADQHNLFTADAFTRLQDATSLAGAVSGGGITPFSLSGGTQVSDTLENMLAGSPLSFGGLVSRGSTGETFASLGSLGAPSSPERSVVNELYSTMSRSAKMRALKAQLQQARAEVGDNGGIPFDDADPVDLDDVGDFSDDGLDPGDSVPTSTRRRPSAKRRSSGTGHTRPGTIDLNNTQEGFSGNTDHNILGLTQEFVSREIQRQSLFDSVRLDTEAIRSRHLAAATSAVSGNNARQKRMRTASNMSTGLAGIDGINMGVNNLRLQHSPQAQGYRRSQSRSQGRGRGAGDGVDFGSAWADDLGVAGHSKPARSDIRRPSEREESLQPHASSWGSNSGQSRSTRQQHQQRQWASARPGSNGRQNRDRWAQAYSTSRPNSNDSDWLVPSIGSAPVSLESHSSSRPGSADPASLLFSGSGSGRLSLARYSLSSQQSVGGGGGGGGGASSVGGGSYAAGFSPSNYFGGAAGSNSGSPSGSPFARAMAAASVRPGSAGSGFPGFSPTHSLSPLPSLGLPPNGGAGIFSLPGSGQSSLTRMSPTAQQLQRLHQAFQAGEITEEQRRQMKNQVRMFTCLRTSSICEVFMFG